MKISDIIRRYLGLAYVFPELCRLAWRVAMWHPSQPPGFDEELERITKRAYAKWGRA